MKSIKRGRGPSFKGGIGSVFAAIFGVIWTIVAVGMGAGFMAIFGIVFIASAIFNAIYDFKNATGKNRYSEYDITDGNEEVDPMNERFGSQKSYSNQNSVESKFCPYCGTAVKEQYEYCNNCGKKLP